MEKKQSLQNQTIRSSNEIQLRHNQDAEKATIGGALLLEKTAIYEVMDFLSLKCSMMKILMKYTVLF